MHNNTSAFSDELNVRFNSIEVLRTYIMNSEQVYTDWHYVSTKLHQVYSAKYQA